jgi:hypothetical protein
VSCLNPLHQRLSALALGELDREASLAVLAHAEVCPACSRELDVYADLVTVGTGVIVRTQGRLERWRSRAPKIVFVAAIGFVLLGVLDQLFGPSKKPTYAELADRSLPTTFEVDDDDPYESELAQAVASFGAGDLAATVDELDRFLDLHPDHAVARFHRALASRELGRVENARADLKTLVANTQGTLRDDATWALANLELTQEDPTAALAALGALESSGGEAAERASELATRVRALR